MHVHSLERKSVLAYLKTVRYTFYDLMPCFLISQVFGNLSVHIEVNYWARIRVYMGHRIPLSECSLNLHDWNLKTNLSSLISWRWKIKTTGMTNIQYYVTSWSRVYILVLTNPSNYFIKLQMKVPNNENKTVKERFNTCLHLWFDISLDRQEISEEIQSLVPHFRSTTAQ